MVFIIARNVNLNWRMYLIFHLVVEISSLSLWIVKKHEFGRQSQYQPEDDYDYTTSYSPYNVEYGEEDDSYDDEEDEE